MRVLRPPAVYVSDRARADRRCAARLDAMMARIECDRVVDVTDDDIEGLLARSQWSRNRRHTGTRKVGDPPILFNRYRWLSAEEEARYAAEFPGRSGSAFFGFGAFRFRDGDEQRSRHNIVCQSAWEAHTVAGCLFKCDYCAIEDYLNVMLDLEEWTERLEALIAGNPWQSLYKYDSQSDILTFEPEYGASRILVPMFARQPNAWLMHYTKSANVEPLLGLKHGGHTIVCWSLSAHTQSRLIERDTATAEERIEAGHRCQQAGYHVRYRLSPIVPVRNWRQENRDLIRLLFSRVRPDVISLLTLSRFPDYDIVERCLDTSLLDERFLAAMRLRPDEVRDRLYGPIPHALRKEMYLFCLREIRAADPTVPVSICLETHEMWRELGEELDLDPAAYPCCCGPHCVPGHPLMARQPRGRPDGVA